MINTRHAYDKELERMIERNEYQLNPYEQPFKPSFLDYNYYNRKPVILDRLTGYERTIAEYHLHNRKKIKRLEEDECMELLKYIFPDIYKIKTDVDNDFDKIDYHVPSYNLYIEHKERGKVNKGCFFDEDGGMSIDRAKYNVLMEQENGYFLNSTSLGIFMWNVKLLGELEWISQGNTPVTSTFEHGIGKTENCDITYLPYEKCNDLTYLLLQYN
jgi:hypothetical protein